MLSVPHLVIIFIVALAVLGPEKLPQVARTLGKAMADFRRVTGDFRYQIENEMREMDRQARLKEIDQQNRIAAAGGTVANGAPDGAVPRSTTPEEGPEKGIVSSDPQNPYVQAEESARTAELNLSAPYASGPAPSELPPGLAMPPERLKREAPAPPQPESEAAEPPAELAPAEHQKLGNAHS